MTETEIMHITGYSRQRLRELRVGCSRVVCGVKYVYPPELRIGSDWVKADTGRKCITYHKSALVKLQGSRNPAK